MSYSIKHYLEIKTTVEVLYKSITTKEGIQAWWTECPIYDCEIGGKAHFIFKGNGFHNVMSVSQLAQNKLVEWIVEQGNRQWVDTTIVFEIIEQENSTHLRFSHNLWAEQTDFFGHCSFHWGKYLMSLKNLLETGKGNPYLDY